MSIFVMSLNTLRLRIGIIAVLSVLAVSCSQPVVVETKIRVLPVPADFVKVVKIDEEGRRFVGRFKYQLNQIPLYRLSGPDAYKFQINPEGVLRFKMPPDYEKPEDSSKDNNYRITINFYDGNGGVARHKLEVNVRNRDENKIAPVPINVRAGLSSNGKMAFLPSSKSGTKNISVLAVSLPSGIADEQVKSVEFSNLLDNKSLGQATEIRMGKALMQLNSSIAEGEYLLSAKLVLHDGKFSSLSDPLYLEVYRTPPAAPKNLVVGNADGPVAANVSEVSKNLTYILAESQKNSKVRFYYIGKNNAEVEITKQGVSVLSNGLARFDFFNYLPSGRYVFFARAVDSAENKSVKSEHRTIIISDPSSKPPSFPSNLPNEVRVQEQSRIDVPGSFVAAVQNGDKVTYSLKGADKNLFIYENGGLRFDFYPDFEVKNSAGKSSEYELKLIATNKYGHTAEHDLNVIITDAEEDVGKPPRPLGLRLYNFNNKDRRMVFLSNGQKTKYVCFQAYAPAGSFVLVYSKEDRQPEKRLGPLEPYTTGSTKFLSRDPKTKKHFVHFLDERREARTVFVVRTVEENGDEVKESDDSNSVNVIMDSKPPEKVRNIFITKESGGKIDVSDLLGKGISSIDIPVSDHIKSFEAEKQQAGDWLIVAVKPLGDENFKMLHNQEGRSSSLKETIVLSELPVNPFKDESGDYITGTYQVSFYAMEADTNNSDNTQQVVTINVREENEKN